MAKVDGSPPHVHVNRFLEERTIESHGLVLSAFPAHVKLIEASL